MDCYLFDAVRTPRGKGKAGGALSTLPPVELATTALRALPDRMDFDPSAVEDVVLGCVEPVMEQGSCIARIAALLADYGQDVPGVQINRFCASGLEATNMAAAKVMAGMCQLTVGGGVESMSRVPMGASRGAWATDPNIAHQTSFIPQGVSADLLATLDGVTREDCDAFAVVSQQRAAAAWEGGLFEKSVVPVKDRNGLLVLDRDEHMRPSTSVESLGKLRAAFSTMGSQYGFDAVALQKYPELERIEHVHTAGNSSGIVDGAAAVLLGSAVAAEAHGLTPRARIVSFASIGSEPTIMLDGPAAAARRALDRAGLSATDIDLWEINEAFSAVVLRFISELELDVERVNVNGGAIAMGHPLGATGAMILGTLLDEMERRELRYGLAALCVGAGMGTATIIERL
jgi:acetyl-CoA C-acetyltransferase